jgi:hypothetical protein
VCIHRIERFVCHHFHKTKVSDSISPQARRINGRPNKNTERKRKQTERLVSSRLNSHAFNARKLLAVRNKVIILSGVTTYSFKPPKQQTNHKGGEARLAGIYSDPSLAYILTAHRRKLQTLKQTISS